MTDLNAKNAWADTQPSQWGPEPAKIEIPLGESPSASSGGAATAASAVPAMPQTPPALSLWA